MEESSVSADLEYRLLTVRVEMLKQLIHALQVQSLAYEVLAAESKAQAQQLKHPWKTGLNKTLLHCLGCLRQLLPYRTKRFLKNILVNCFDRKSRQARKQGLVDVAGFGQSDCFHLFHDVLREVLLVDSFERDSRFIREAIEAGWDVFVVSIVSDAEKYQLKKLSKQKYQVTLSDSRQLSSFCHDFKIHCPLVIARSEQFRATSSILPGCIELGCDVQYDESMVFSDVLSGCFPKISVIVLTYNNLDYTKACLSSIDLNTHYPNLELIIVDNASSDETARFLKTYQQCHDKVNVILNPENLGFAKGNNVGIDYASGDYIVVLNNDTYVTEGWLHGMLRHFHLNPQLGLLGPVTNNIDNEAKITIDYNDMLEMQTKAQAYTQSHSRQQLKTKHVSFFCTMIPRFMLDKVGALSEDYSVGMFEDDDYCQRVLKAGYEIAIAEDVFVHHQFSASIGKLNLAFQEELLARNKAVFENKWGPWSERGFRN
jgi:GT2 family glycosyltransferase